MASFDTARSAYVATGFAGRIGDVFVSAFGAFAAWNDERTTRASLERLTDHELSDIGLTRYDIEDVVKGR